MEGQIIGCLHRGHEHPRHGPSHWGGQEHRHKVLVDLGQACTYHQDKTLRNLDCKTVEADEIWSFCYAKQQNDPDDFKGTPGYGDVWT